MRDVLIPKDIELEPDAFEVGVPMCRYQTSTSSQPFADEKSTLSPPSNELCGGIHENEEICGLEQ